MKKLLLFLLLPLTLFGQSQKISDMTSATALTGSEYVPIVQTTNKKSTVTLLRGWASTIGTAGQLLKVNSGATALEFFTPSYLTSVGTGVANELTYWSGTNTLGSLATATYPSLTELSYVKGLTSAAQTQLGTRWPNTGSLSLTGTVNITGSQELNLGTYASPLYAQYNVSTAYIHQVVKATSDNVTLLNASGFQISLNNPASVFKFIGTSAPSVGHVWTASNVDGTGYWAAPSGGGLTVGTSTVTSGTNTRVLYNNSGVLGEYTVSGSGNVAMTTSPTFTTPILGTPTSGTLTNTTGYLFNNLAAATGSNTINNAANDQVWQWNTLGSGTGLLLSSSSTAAASNTNTVFRVNQTGANSTSTQSTYSGYFSNTKTGTSSTNYAGFFTASGGSTNYAIYATTGQSRIGDILFNSSASNVIQTSSSSTRLDLRGASGAVSLGIVLGDQQTYTGAGGMTALKNMMSWTSSSVTSTFKSFSIAPTINVTSGTGTLYGLIYEPTLTSTAGLSNHYAFYANSGDVVIAGGSLSVSGAVTNQNQNIQNVGTTGSDVYRRKVDWAPVTASGATGNQDFNIFLADVITNSTCTVTITVTGVNSDGTKSYSKEMKATFRKPGTSDMVQVGSTTDIYEHSDGLTTPTSSISVSSDTMRISYDSGTGAPTVRWTFFIETFYSTN